MKTLYIVVFLCLLVTTARAQNDNKMHTDWPDQSEDVHAMKPGELQLETGFSLTRFSSGEDAAIGHELIRYGFIKQLELRLVVEDGKHRDRYMEETSQSIYPLAASVKYSLIDDHQWLPDITLVGYLKLPFTSRSKEQKAYWSPAFVAAFENNLAEKLKLEYNAGIRQEAYSKEHLWMSTTGFMYDITDKLEVFIEHFAQYQSSKQP
jgi:hypothetical protein